MTPHVDEIDFQVWMAKSNYSMRNHFMRRERWELQWKRFLLARNVYPWVCDEIQSLTEFSLLKHFTLSPLPHIVPTLNQTFISQKMWNQLDGWNLHHIWIMMTVPPWIIAGCTRLLPTIKPYFNCASVSLCSISVIKSFILGHVLLFHSI